MVLIVLYLLANKLNSGPSKFYGRQRFKNFQLYGLFKQTMLL